MDPISIALGLAEFVPSLIGWFTGDDKDADKAEKVLAIAKTFAGTNEGEFSAILRSDPEAAIAFQKSVMNLQIELAREDTKQMQTVNNSMQAEGKSEHWMQWSWRPFNGYAFGISLFLLYVLPALINMGFAIFHVVDGIDNVPRVIVITGVPEFVLVAWGAVLGVTAWRRGQEKLAKVAGKLL